MLRFIFGIIIGMLVMILIVSFLPIESINDYFSWTDKFRGTFGDLSERNITCTEQPEEQPEESPTPSPA